MCQFLLAGSRGFLAARRRLLALRAYELCEEDQEWVTRSAGSVYILARDRPLRQLGPGC